VPKPVLCGVMELCGLPCYRYYAEGARQGRILARSKQPVVPLQAASDLHLKKVFKSYCRLRVGQGRQVGASVQHINAAQFNQLARDAGLVEPLGKSHQHCHIVFGMQIHVCVGHIQLCWGWLCLLSQPGFSEFERPNCCV
jgi:hypothetical protein